MLTVTQYMTICTVLHDVLAPFCSPSVARKFTEPRVGASNADQQLLTLPWFFSVLPLARMHRRGSNSGSKRDGA
jgi:hypothetical protein